MYIDDIAWLSSSLNEKYLRQISGQNQNLHFVFGKFFFENRSVYVKNNILQPDRPRTTIYYGACALRAG